MQIEWTKSLWKSKKHCAFTDLCEYQGQLVCSFRQASDHMGIDGSLKVVSCDFNGRVLHSSSIKMPNCDLRDPKLSIMPDGKLLMNAYARCYDANGNWTHSRSLCWFSQDLKSWSSCHWFGDQNWWVWRLTWHQGIAYGMGYNRATESIRLYQGDPLRSFHCEKSNLLGLQSHGLGYPNETDLCFNQQGTAFAVVRRDADTFSAQFGQSDFPYRQWKWHDLEQYIGGPAVLLWDSNKLIISGRRWHNRQFKTALWSLDTQHKKLQFEAELPSAGDSSYPGLVRRNDSLYVGYYSSHIDQQSSIYLSKVIAI
ncbi:hypothetical protein [Aliiglaciecola sp. LCG003]|uniref:hypothetical protein n=1 Tax=Aliiglaciecola sp. LCG003 TaxID=3053655 RepID=UPI0025747CA2|nr:hypothetical protein [Aliiglaciecola sp. LCG003]WJG10558.1 hypothetical protein QR722_05830 [Aliiglaciecola sp. LCG003]